MQVRTLLPNDARAYTALRLEMLHDSPWAFAASPADDAGLDVARLTSRMEQPGYAIAGGFDGEGTLVGVAGVHLPHHLKMAHRAHIWGVYITPRHRGVGLGRRIMEHVLGIARGWPGVTSAGLSVSEHSPGAQRLYERLGFRAWGREPAALMHDGRAYDEVHMVVQF